MLQKRTQNNTPSNLPSWDLSAFFSGVDDPRIPEACKENRARAAAFEAQYRPVVSDAISAEQLLWALKEYEAILNESAKPDIFAHLVFATDSVNPAHGALMQRVREESLAVQAHVTFFELALLQLPPSTLRRFAADPALQNYHHYLLRLEHERPHRLSESEEKILNDLSLTGRDAFTRLFDEEFSVKKFRVELNGAVEELPEEETLALLYSEERAKRKAGAAALTQGLMQDLHRNTFITNTLAGDKEIRDRYQKFESPEAARHLAEEIAQDVVDTMSAVVSAHYGMVRDFYDFKRKVLGLDVLYDYDRYAPIPAGAEERIAFREAKNTVLTAYERFSPLFRARAEEFFDSRWIDAALRPGKRSGAFCSFGTPDTHPVVFVNYVGQIKSVLTLAHELGHGVHASLMRGQTPLNFDTPLTVAETASVFGEMLVFDSLRAIVTDPRERLRLYMGKIEEIFATVFRQHAMYTFEQDVHAARRAKGELTAEEIGAFWRARQQEMFGGAVTLTGGYSVWWSYIPHFVHTPFYVYAYVFGELLVLSLYAQYQKADAAGKKAFVENYITMLSSGGSKTPQELVAPFGITLTEKTFWESGMEPLRKLIQEAKALYN